MHSLGMPQHMHMAFVMHPLADSEDPHRDIMQAKSDAQGCAYWSIEPSEGMVLQPDAQQQAAAAALQAQERVAAADKQATDAQQQAAAAAQRAEERVAAADKQATDAQQQAAAAAQRAEEQMQTLREQFTADLDAVQASLSRRDQEVTRLTKRVSELEQQQLKDQDEALTRMGKQVQKISTLEQQLGDKATACEELTRELVNAGARLTKVCGEADQARTSHEANAKRLTKDLTDEKVESARLSAALEAVQASLGQRELHVNVLQQKVDQLLQKAKQASVAYDVTQSIARRAAADARQQHQEEVYALKKRVTESVSAAAASVKACNDLTAQLEQAKLDLSAAQEALRVREGENNTLTSQLREVSTQARELAAEAEESRERAAAAEQKASQAEQLAGQQAATAQRALDQLQQATKAAKEQATQAQQQAAREKSWLEAEAMHARVKEADQKRQARGYAAQLEQVRQSLVEAHEQIKLLEEKHRTLQQRLQFWVAQRQPRPDMDNYSLIVSLSGPATPSNQSGAGVTGVPGLPETCQNGREGFTSAVQGALTELSLLKGSCDTGRLAPVCTNQLPALQVPVHAERAMGQMEWQPGSEEPSWARLEQGATGAMPCKPGLGSRPGHLGLGADLGKNPDTDMDFFIPTALDPVHGGDPDTYQDGQTAGVLYQGILFQPPVEGDFDPYLQHPPGAVAGMGCSSNLSTDMREGAQRRSPCDVRVLHDVDNVSPLISLSQLGGGFTSGLLAVNQGGLAVGQENNHPSPAGPSNQSGAGVTGVRGMPGTHQTGRAGEPRPQRGTRGGGGNPAVKQPTSMRPAHTAQGRGRAPPAKKGHQPPARELPPLPTPVPSGRDTRPPTLDDLLKYVALLRSLGYSEDGAPLPGLSPADLVCLDAMIEKLEAQIVVASPTPKFSEPAFEDPFLAAWREIGPGAYPLLAKAALSMPGMAFFIGVLKKDYTGPVDACAGKTVILPGTHGQDYSYQPWSPAGGVEGVVVYEPSNSSVEDLPKGRDWYRMEGIDLALLAGGALDLTVDKTNAYKKAAWARPIILPARAEFGSGNVRIGRKMLTPVGGALPFKMWGATHVCICLPIWTASAVGALSRLLEQLEPVWECGDQDLPEWAMKIGLPLLDKLMECWIEGGRVTRSTPVPAQPKINTGWNLEITVHGYMTRHGHSGGIASHGSWLDGNYTNDVKDNPAVSGFKQVLNNDQAFANALTAVDSTQLAPGPLVSFTGGGSAHWKWLSGKQVSCLSCQGSGTAASLDISASVSKALQLQVLLDKGSVFAVTFMVGTDDPVTALGKLTPRVRGTYVYPTLVAYGAPHQKIAERVWGQGWKAAAMREVIQGLKEASLYKEKGQPHVCEYHMVLRW